MREIKFRGVTFKGDWVYGDLSTDASGLSFDEGQWLRRNLTENKSKDSLTAYWRETTKRISWKEGRMHCNAPVDPKTIGQYTGLKDKNGVEIYEGDALNHPYFDNPIIVQWNDNDACFESNGVVSEWSSCEVVGNIYENPELLEK